MTIITTKQIDGHWFNGEIISHLSDTECQAFIDSGEAVIYEPIAEPKKEPKKIKDGTDQI